MGWIEGLVVVMMVAAITGLVGRFVDNRRNKRNDDWCRTNKH